MLSHVALAEVLAGGRASYTVSRLLQHDNVAPQVRANAELFGDMTVVVTESFAGTGVFAAKVVDVCAEVSRIWKKQITVVLYCAWDSSQTAAKALLNHPPKSRPLHVFPDVLDRVPKDKLSLLVEVE